MGQSTYSKLTKDVYMMKLSDGKYYVGMTINPTKNIDDYYETNPWLDKYKPISIMKIKNNVANLDEYVIKQMCKYGVENVRGGSYNSILLSQIQFSTINIMDNYRDLIVTHMMSFGMIPYDL